jgi:hypothetical protein
MLAEPVLKLVRRELRKASDGVKVDLQEVEQIVRSEVIRRNLIEGEEAEEAQKVVSRLYRKNSSPRRRKKKQPAETAAGKEEGTLSDRLLADAGNGEEPSSAAGSGDGA